MAEDRKDERVPDTIVMRPGEIELGWAIRVYEHEGRDTGKEVDTVLYAGREIPDKSDLADMLCYLPSQFEEQVDLLLTLTRHVAATYKAAVAATAAAAVSHPGGEGTAN